MTGLSVIDMGNHEKLIIFVKAPVAGKVKTRLAPPLTLEQACELYRSWAQDTYETGRLLNNVHLEIAYDAHVDFPTPNWLSRESRDISFFRQRGKSLGERLIHAFKQAFQNGAERVVIIGSDSPGLPISYILEAFESLRNNNFVIGPTEDGGFYLIGFHNKVVPEVFRNVEWSTSNVFSMTMQNTRNIYLSTHILPGYFDIDRPEDLLRLEARSLRMRGRPVKA